MLEGGDLYTYIKQYKRLNESEARHIFSQLMEAMKFMKSKGVAHRDLKLENVLLGSKDIKKCVVKVADFGLSDF